MHATPTHDECGIFQQFFPQVSALRLNTPSMSAFEKKVCNVCMPLITKIQPLAREIFLFW